MKVNFNRFSGVLVLLILSCSVVWAQSTAQLSGRVTDQTGAVLPGVEITATQTDTGIARNTISDETGSYILPNLAIGPYRLEAGLPGFRSYVQTGIVLQVSSSPTVNIALEVGQVTEQIEVQANAVQVETRSVGIGQVIENQRILELPLDGRQVTQLILLAGGAVQTELGAPHRNPRGSVVMRVAGAAGGTTLYTLDGNLHVDAHALNNLPLPFPDALQEFKVESSAGSPTNGMFSGAWVNAVTKSGTNEFHGSLFEFVRNDLFNARNYFAVRNSTLKRNQFGGTFGGPIVRNKLFFFGGIQRETVRTDPADRINYVPTEQMLQGDFTTIASTQCRPTPLTLAAPFVNNRIDPARFSPGVMRVVRRSDFPRAADPCGKLTFGMRTVTNQNQIISRIDYQLNQTHSLFGRVMFDMLDQPPAYDLGGKTNILQTQRDGEGYDNLVQAYAVGATSLVNPNTVNSFRISTSRSYISRAISDSFVPSDVGSTAYTYGVDNPGWRSFMWTVTDGFEFGASSGPVITQAYQVNDEVSYIRGSHQFNFGVSLAHWRNYSRSNAYSPGRWTNNGQVTGHGLADFMLGALSNFRQAPPVEDDTSQSHFGAFAADTWQATPRLTLTYGLRWEPRFQLVLRSGHMTNFSHERMLARQPSTIFRNSPYGLLYPGEPGFENADCRDSGVCNAKGAKDQWWAFAPRLGFAWDIRGDGRLALRSSYGIAYDVRAAGGHIAELAAPWKPDIVIPFPPGGFDDPWQGYPGGNPHPIPGITNKDTNVPFYPSALNFAMNPDPEPTTTHMWNLGIQSQLGTQWMVEGSYIGNRTLNIWTTQQLNPVIYIPGQSNRNNTEARRLFRVNNPNLGGTVQGSITYRGPTDAQSYHGMLLRLERRPVRGVSVNANYTWSHCTGTSYGNYRLAGPAGSGLYDFFNRETEKGNCEADRRRIFNSTVVAETPQFANTALRRIATGWRLSGLYRRQSGAWLTLTSGLDTLFIVSNVRPIQINENPYGDRSSLNNYFNPAAFARPATGNYGNMGPSNVEGPATWAFDMALSRTFQFREDQRIEVRAEAFNVTNSLRRGNPGVNLNSSQFGRITSSGDPRIMQFALKYVF